MLSCPSGTKLYSGNVCLDDHVTGNAAIATPIVVVAAAIIIVVIILCCIKREKKREKPRKINKLNAIPRTARGMVEIMDFEEPAKHIHDRVQ